MEMEVTGTGTEPNSLGSNNDPGESSVEKNVPAVGFIRDIFIFHMDFFLNLSTNVIRLGVETDMQADEIKIKGRRLIEELRKSNRPVMYRLIDSQMISTIYVLEGILNHKNWMSMIDNYHSQTLKLVGITTYILGSILLAARPEDEYIVDMMVVQVGRPELLSVFNKILTDWKAFTKRLKEMIDILYGDRHRKIIGIIQACPKTMLDVTSVMEIRKVHSVDKWETIMLETAGAYTVNQATNNEKVNNLLKVVKEVKNIFYGPEYSSPNREVQFESRRQLSKVIENYHNSQQVSKSLREFGIVSSANTISSLVTEVIRALDGGDNSREDSLSLGSLKSELMQMIDSSKQWPPHVMFRILQRDLEPLFEVISPSYKQLLDDSISRSIMSASYPEAWNNAVKIKGLLYEICFAETFGLPYAPEVSKLTLNQIVHILYPNAATTFLRRSAEKHMIRDYKPDFFVPYDPIRLEPRRPRFTRPNLTKSAERFYKTGQTEPVGPEEDENPVIKWLKNTVDINTKLARLLREVTTARERKYKFNRGGVEDKILSDQEVFSKSGLVIIEVGYQTSSESKTIIDSRKWKAAANILSSCGIDCTILTLSESTQEMKVDSWLRKDLSTLVSKAVGSLFSKLIATMPPSLSNILVGDISSQQLRSLSSEFRPKTCPVSKGDLIDCHVQNKAKLFIRPNGTHLPLHFQRKFVKSLITGSLIKESDAHRVKEHLSRNATSIIESVDQSNLCLTKVDDCSPYLFYYSYMKEELESVLERTNVCHELKKLASECNTACKQLINCLKKEDLSDIDASKFKLRTSLSNFIIRKGHHRSIVLHNCGVSEADRCTIPAIFRLLHLCGTKKIQVRYSKDDRYVDEVTKSSIDSVSSLTLPGRNAKQKETKGIIRSILETISGLSQDGFLKTESGLLLSTHKDILLKSNCITGVETGVEKVQVEEEYKIREESTSSQAAPRERKATTVKKQILEKLDSVLKRRDCLTEEAVESLSRMREDIRSTRVTESDKGHQLFKQLRVSSYIHGQALLDSMHLLLFDSVHTDPLKIFFKGKEEKAKQMKLKEERESDYRLVSDNMLSDHLSLCESLTEILENETEIEIIPEVVLKQVRESIQPTTPAGVAWESAQKALDIIRHTRLGRALRLYSYICQTFLIAVSDMSFGGIKVLKVMNSSTNILIQVGKSKATNCPCILMDEGMNSITPRFYLNRSVATLGQSLMACVFTNFVQLMQTSSCFDLLSMPLSDILVKVAEHLPEAVTRIGKFISDSIRQGYNESTAESLYGSGTMPWELPKPEGQIDRQSQLIACHLACLCFVIVPGVIRNSRKDNKVLQMVRHPYMLSLSDFGFPLGVGAKLSSPIRNTCTLVLSRFLAQVCCINLEFAKPKLEEWTKSNWRPTSNTVSISLFPLTCGSDRQFTSDMYFCHWYNKEMDDFQEGSIRVMNEAFEKVMDWEEELSKEIEQFEHLTEVRNSVDKPLSMDDHIQKMVGDDKIATKPKSDLREVNMHICCLLGIKNINTEGVDKDLLQKPHKTVSKVGSGKEKRVQISPVHFRLDRESNPSPEVAEIAPRHQDSNRQTDKTLTQVRDISEIRDTSARSLALEISSLRPRTYADAWRQGVKSIDYPPISDEQRSESNLVRAAGKGTTFKADITENLSEKSIKPADTSSSDSSSVSDSSSTRSKAVSTISVPITVDSETVSATSLKTIQDFDLKLKIEDMRQFSYHSVSLDYILDAAKYVSSKQFPFSCGVPEIIQAFTEISREQYSDINISKSLRTKDNNEQISSISETTSILASSLQKVDLKSYFRTIISKGSMKLAKILSKSTRNTTATSEKSRSFSKLLEALISAPGEERGSQERLVVEALKELKANARLHWKDTVTASLENLLFTDDVSLLFRTTKTLWKDCKRVASAEYKSMFQGSKELLENIKNIQTKTVGRGFINRLNADSILLKNSELISMGRDKITKMVLTEFQKAEDRNESTSRTIHGVSVSSALVAKIMKVFEIVREVYILLEEHKEFKIKYPDASDSERVNQIEELERELIDNNGRTLVLLVVWSLAVSMFNNFTVGGQGFNKYLLQINREVITSASDEFSDIGLDEGPMVKSLFQNKGLNAYAEDLVRALYDNSDPTKYIFDFLIETTQNLFTRDICELVLSFLIKLYFGVRNPLTSLLNTEFEKVTSASELSRAVKNLIARLHGKSLYLDFVTTVSDTVSGSLVVVRRLLGRQSKTVTLPRSVRSKVIYQMYELSVMLRTTNVQEMAFQLALDKTHTFYGGLAPKAQIGGDRDLIVQERKTKVVVHTNEMLCKSLMSESVTNDGLTNPRLKEQILSRASDEMLSSRRLHGSEVTDGLIMFYKVWNVVGDCSKWGPIHETSQFSCAMQQLLKNVEGWCFYSMLVHYKSLFKEIEIPVASIEKVINSLLADDDFRKDAMPKFDSKSIKEFSDIVAEHVKKLWNSNKIVKETVASHLSKGRAAVRSYSHMGQGIHHRQSSLLASLCHFVIDRLVSEFIMGELTPLTCKIEHAGSSDDFSKIIIVSGEISRRLFRALERRSNQVIELSLKYMMGLMRCCQMMVSVKSCVSRFVAEFYSEFDFMGSVSPPFLKFISNQLINHSVSTPNTLHQGTLVESQQALYMGVPLSTNIVFCIFKQSLFIENSLFFFRNWGEVVFQSFPSMGRLFLPSLARLVSGSAGQDELQILIASCERIRNLLLNRIDLIDPEHFRLDNNPQGASFREQIRQHDSAFTARTDNLSDLSEAQTIHSSGGVRLFQTVNNRASVDHSSTTSVSETLHYDTEVQGDQSGLLNVVFWRYYKNSGIRSEGVGSSDRFQKMLDMSDTGTALVDPFLQILPESVVYQVEKLKEMKQKIDSHINSGESSFRDTRYTMAAGLIGASVVTDDYGTEISRLMQALRSKHIIRGLAGGMREISLPIHRQMLRGFFFHNRTGVKGLSHWVSRDNSKYLSGNKSNVPGVERVRVSSFLSKISDSTIIEYYEMLDLLEHLKLTDSVKLDGCESDPESSIYNIPVDLIDLSEAEIVEGAEEAITENGLYLVVHVDKLADYIRLVNRISDDITSSVYRELVSLERREVNSVIQSKGEEMRKTVIYGSGDRKSLSNKIPVLLAAHLSMNAVIDLRPRGLDTSKLNSDLSTLMNQNRFLRQWLEKKLEQLEASSLHSEDSTKRQAQLTARTNEVRNTEQVISECLTYCRLIEHSYSKSIKLFMFSPDDAKDVVTDYALLVQRSTLENCTLLLETGRSISVQDSQIFTVLGVISVVNWLDITEEEKIIFLRKFFQTQISLAYEYAKSHQEGCRWSRLLGTSPMLSEAGSFGDFLLRRSQFYRNTRDSSREESIQNLVQTILGQNSLVPESSISDEKPIIYLYGDQGNRQFTFSNPNGTASGLITRNKLLLVLNGPVEVLLALLERPIMEELRNTGFYSEPSLQRQQFFRLLPSISELGSHAIDGLRFVVLKSDGRYHSVRNLESLSESMRLDARYVSVTNLQQAPRYSKVRSDSSVVDIRFFKRRIEVGVTAAAVTTTLPATWVDLQRNVEELFGKKLKNKLERKTAGHKIWVIRSVFRTEISVSKETIALFHMFSSHFAELMGPQIDLLPNEGRLVLGNSEMVEISDTTLIDLRTELDSGELIEKIKTSESDVPNDVEDKISKLLSEQTGGSSLVIPLHYMLDLLVGDSSKLSFSGFSDGSLSEVGLWHSIISSTKEFNQLETVLSSLIRLKKNEYTSMTYIIGQSCWYESELAVRIERLCDMIGLEKNQWNNLKVVLLIVCNLVETVCLPALGTVNMAAKSIMLPILRVKGTALTHLEPAFVLKCKRDLLECEVSLIWTIKSQGARVSAQEVITATRRTLGQFSEKFANSKHIKAKREKDLLNSKVIRYIMNIDMNSINRTGKSEFFFQWLSSHLATDNSPNNLVGKLLTHILMLVWTSPDNRRVLPKFINEMLVHELIEQPTLLEEGVKQEFDDDEFTLEVLKGLRGSSESLKKEEEEPDDFYNQTLDFTGDAGDIDYNWFDNIV
ncbi:RNA-dependent RNA polymerase [red goblin roach virus 1]|uniref:RNA-directed RNA polymerase L n=1 Tax=red goblin roach virus 1 TaxID=3118717 RepID=A0A7D7JJ32_9VIRU|nr:RNA-dependent RNA polymerase [red goblin roach virus 1]QMP82413.1 RNA-dependent RNA polymerase [red goblin roach virus 1]